MLEQHGKTHEKKEREKLEGIYQIVSQSYL